MFSKGRYDLRLFIHLENVAIAKLDIDDMGPGGYDAQEGRAVRDQRIQDQTQECARQRSRVTDPLIFGIKRMVEVVLAHSNDPVVNDPLSQFALHGFFREILGVRETRTKGARYKRCCRERRSSMATQVLGSPVPVRHGHDVELLSRAVAQP